jgi:signal transduction histidine kinase
VIYCHASALPVCWESAAAAKYLRFCIDPATYLIQSDPHLLAIILNNVVGNAVRHTSTGAVTVAHTVEGRAVVIAVSDTGPGIPEEALRRSFGFCPRSVRAKEGMGLGLSIARRSAEILGHEFEISAPVSGGTCIRLHVPLAI